MPTPIVDASVYFMAELIQVIDGAVKFATGLSEILTVAVASSDAHPISETTLNFIV